MYIEQTSPDPRYSIQELTNEDVYLILQGLRTIQERIKIKPTEDNVKYAAKIEFMISEILNNTIVQ